MVASELTMAFSSIKTAIEIVKFISNSNKDASIKEKTIELQDTILSIQSTFTDLNERYFKMLSLNNDLKKELEQVNQWKDTKSQYKLIKGVTGTLVYVPNEFHPNPDPTHYLCTNCYCKRKKSILQAIEEMSDYICPDCGMKIFFRSE